MPDTLYHQSLRLKNFTVFQHNEFEFVPGINVFVGENGTGKTHLMKALYAAQLTKARQIKSISETLGELFQTNNLAQLVRLQASPDAFAEVRGSYGEQEWMFSIWRDEGTDWSASETSLQKVERPVFIPALDMMGHTKGFLQAASEVVLDFDLTCSDLVSLLGLQRRNGNRSPIVLEGIRELLGGTLEQDQNSGRFYLVTPQGRMPMPLVAEGLRKIATLVRLAQNGWLTPGATLFWDEPEVNLNPVLMDEIVGALLGLARQGVQVFLATHSYVILKEIDLQAQPSDSVSYFGFERNDTGTTVNATDDLNSLEPNPILEQYESLYDRELTRSTGRNRRGERVR